MDEQNEIFSVEVADEDDGAEEARIKDTYLARFTSEELVKYRTLSDRYNELARECREFEGVLQVWTDHEESSMTMKREYRYKGTNPALALFFTKFTIRWSVFEVDEGYDSFWLTEAEAEGHEAKTVGSLSDQYDAEDLDEMYDVYPVIIEVECRDEQPVWQITAEEFAVLAAECEVDEGNEL